jgi:hypothetical protein
MAFFLVYNQDLPLLISLSASESSSFLVIIYLTEGISAFRTKLLEFPSKESIFAPSFILN